MYKTKSKTNEHGKHVYDSPAIGKVMYDPLEADVTKTFEAHIFKRRGASGIRKGDGTAFHMRKTDPGTGPRDSESTQ